MYGLIIKEPWIDLIFEGKKTWEIRGTNTLIRRTIALIKSGTGCIFGTAELISTKRLTINEFCSSENKHRIKNLALPYQKPMRGLENPLGFQNPILYNHPMEAVIWDLSKKLF